MSQPVPRNIFILGGTGKIGQLVIVLALQRGHRVTALVRKPGTLTPHANLSCVVGSPTSTSDIARALALLSATPGSGPVTVISTLGQTRANMHNPWSTPTSPPLYMSQAIQALSDALASSPTPAHTSRVVILGVFGTGNARPHMAWALRALMHHSAMRQTMDDHEAILRVVPRFAAPVVVVRPPMIRFGVETAPVPPVTHHGDGGENGGVGLLGGVDARSLAAFIVDRVGDGETGEWDGRMPVITT